MSLDTFWGSFLSFSLNNHKYLNRDSISFPSIVNIFIFSLLSVCSSADHALLCNLIISISSTDYSIIKAISSLASSYLLNLRFRNSFKPGERIILSELISILVLKAYKNQFKGWPAFFLFVNIFSFVSPFLFRKQFNLIPLGGWIVLSSAFALNFVIITELINEILNNSLLILYWSFILSITIVSPLIFSKYFSNQNFLRKFYHFSAVSLFIPAAFLSLKILQISMAFAGSIFLLLETIRNEANSKHVKAKFFEKLNEFMGKCRNDLDSGEMIFSHLYLLLGCGIPFWFNTNNLKLSSFAGVISLGIGDSLASIAGKAYGRINWHTRTRKTIEGSICGCMGMLISWIVLVQTFTIPSTIINLFAISLGSSLWEALIDLNDNITLPIFTFILINFLCP